jgi:hypothetical protein
LSPKDEEEFATRTVDTIYIDGALATPQSNALLALRPRNRSDIGIDDRRMTMADFQGSLSLLTD